MIREMLKALEDIYENKLGQNHIYKYCDALQEGRRSKKHKPLLTRIKCSELEFCFHFDFDFFFLNAITSH